MNRSLIQAHLELYRQSWLLGRYPYPKQDPEEEQNMWQGLAAFVESSEQCFERSHGPGHITGSALVVSHDLRQVLLMHHRKLDKWLQMGGHADGDPNPERVALKEAREESGLNQLEILDYWSGLIPEGSPCQAIPFDLDIHTIPARPGEPEHKHYDVRFLVVAAEGQTIWANEEAKELSWFSLAEARRKTRERSMLRQFDKLAYLKSKILPS